MEKINAAQHLRLIFAELGASSTSYSFAVYRVGTLLMGQENWFKAT
ncbi:MAG: hypothetical protein ACJ703_10370 [Nitrososphaera sp.]